MLSGDVSSAYITLPGSITADYGSLWIEVDGTPTACTEYSATTEAATEATGTTTFTYTGITADDVVTYYCIATNATALTQVGACTSVSTEASADTKTYTVAGQANKINVVGATENKASLKELFYNQTFITACMGDALSATPAAAKEKWSNISSGMNTIGALVGKQYNSSDAVVYKWYLINAKATGFSSEFPSDDAYTDSADFLIDARMEVDLS